MQTKLETAALQAKNSETIASKNRKVLQEFDLNKVSTDKYK